MNHFRHVTGHRCCRFVQARLFAIVGYAAIVIVQVSVDYEDAVPVVSYLPPA